MHFIFCFLLFTTIAHANKFDWQGHRGARGLYPENTINGMKESLKYPIHTLEMDVVITKDGEVLLSHEPWIGAEYCLDAQGKEVEDKKHNIYKLTYQDILRFDCGSRPHPRFPQQKKVKETKPLLKDLVAEVEKELKRIKRPEVGYSIEIKSTEEDEKAGFQPEYKAFSDKVVQLLSKILPKEKFIIQSFDWRVLKYIHQKYPDVSLVALREAPYGPKAVIAELGFMPYVFSPDFKLLKKEDIEYFHQHGIKVIPWTVNQTQEFKQLIDMGVDGIITDYPNLISQMGEKACAAGYSLFEGSCRKIPAHAVYSEHNPGWVCDAGYVQRWSSCVEIKLPAHAEFTDDGKTWVCKNGYTRYRGMCKKQR